MEVFGGVGVWRVGGGVGALVICVIEVDTALVFVVWKVGVVGDTVVGVVVFTVMKTLS